MIYFYSRKPVSNENLVYMALIRSFTKSQVIIFNDYKNLQLKKIRILVTCEITDELIELIDCIKKNNVKILFFGKINTKIIKTLKLQNIRIISDKFSYDLDQTNFLATQNKSFESDIKVIYKENLFLKTSSFLNRPIERYDFTDEWNNQNFGRINFTNDFWSVSQIIEISGSSEVAYLYDNKKRIKISSYFGFWNSENLILWVNREASFIDSYEWRIIENFICNFEKNEFTNLPLISEIPFGYNSASTMRADCDEDIKSSEILHNFYYSKNIPFSYAIVGKILDNKNISYLKNLKYPKVLLSHSYSHKENWGGSIEECNKEIINNHQLIKDNFDIDVKYAVSPFHQTNDNSIKALSNNNYKGLVGGNVKNNPAFIYSKGGLVNKNIDFIFHTQQCMLHGDCLLQDNENILISYERAINLAIFSKSIFGYLDHPFSIRYKYGWPSESFRISIHEKLINYLNKKLNLFLNEIDALDFIYDKSLISIENHENSFLLKKNSKQKFNYSIELKNKKYCLQDKLKLNS
jgi:hypothetical protein